MDSYDQGIVAVVVVVVVVDKATSKISQKEDEMKKYRKLVFKKITKSSNDQATDRMETWGDL